MQRLRSVREINSLQPLPLLHNATINLLKTSKNLLAFSGGGDSTALFFLLLEQNIPFDIAHVNYQTREQSDVEEAYAKKLADTYNKQLFTFTCKLENANFEHSARKERYTFFENIIQEHGYNSLLSAHHLNDKLEWFLMQLSRGAGLIELLGMQEIEAREHYTMIRPLLHVNKKTLQAYLENHKITYFTDESNTSFKHVRNQFRHHYANPLIENYAEGIAKSFRYMEEDAKRLLPHQATRIKDLFLLPKDEDDLINIRHIDKIVKLLGILLSKAQRDEILKTKSCVVGGKIAVCFEEEMILIAPYLKQAMEKKFKERCRQARIPSKIRPYLFTSHIDLSALRLDHTL
ncbi:tRNA(Ile)-lysidine synthase [Sulfurospirillum diekertiae]|uniref:tRNA(Ile)-lysidine synthase n=1 Tax=Sulfurospirillum diekertiae TaxID=1854492 RepID=A0A1Y0HIC6_9BACT|nr:tRNA lysidine(34) synthetase TilS [Sulfurospirillum diekertiae]ARU47720.1 tRNA(Ile)-lysidine synthase [Sulfurospirillum diekertiae]ASC92566.1 tRNA(Ile)-lysidine synthase [Sulfurospirillum diekertiae]